MQIYNIIYKTSFISIFLFFTVFLLNNAYATEIRQPIAFSHKTHAKQNEIACEFCHTTARRSSVASIPSVRTCMGCHALVQGTTKEQQTQIKKLKQYWEKKKPILWKKIHDLPDFVYFSHERHIKAGFDCTQCHGEIRDREKITIKTMKADLSMKWCVECHRKKHAVKNKKVIIPLRITRGGAFVDKNKKDKAKAELNTHGVLHYIKGSTDCLACHK